MKTAPHTTGSLPSSSTARGSLFPNGRTGSPGLAEGYPRYQLQNGHQPSPLAFSPAVDGFRPQYAARAVAAGVPAFELG